LDLGLRAEGTQHRAASPLTQALFGQRDGAVGGVPREFF
jgi:hypothetical protein